jgi:phenylacetate-CoA ligase
MRKVIKKLKFILSNKIRKLFIMIREKILKRDSMSHLEQTNHILKLNNIQLSNRLIKQRNNSLLFAFNNSKYYRDIFTLAGLSLNNINSKNWNIVPFTTKENIRDSLETIYSNDYKGKSIIGRTSGSTGVRLAYKYDNGLPVYPLTFSRIFQGLWGIELGMKWVKIWGTQGGLKDNVISKIKTKIKYFADFICGILTLSAHEVSDLDLTKKVLAIQKFKPKGIYGYGTSIFLLAAHINKNNLHAKVETVNLIVYTSEFLTTWQRRIIEEAFRCPVISEYGSVETGIISYECPCGKQHINHESLDIEVLDKSGKINQTGKGQIVVTLFFPKLMPVIRYLLGDIVEIGVQEKPCKYGFSGKYIKNLFGRKNNIIVSRSGILISTQYVAQIMRTVTELKRIQVVEEENFLLNIIIELYKKEDKEKTSKKVEELFNNKLNGDFKVKIVIVDNINDGGKFRWVIGKS